MSEAGGAGVEPAFLDLLVQGIPPGPVAPAELGDSALPILPALGPHGGERCSFEGEVEQPVRPVRSRFLGSLRERPLEHVSVVEVAEQLLEPLELFDPRAACCQLVEKRLEQVAGALGADPRAMGRSLVAGPLDRGELIVELPGQIDQGVRGGVAQPAGGRLLVQADLRPVDREPRAEALVEGVEVPLDPFEDLRVGPGADAAQVLEEVAMARPSRGRQVGLRFEPDERDLGVSPVAGRVRERLEPLGELAADALGEEIPVGPQSAPQAPQADPEVVESLGVLGIVEPEPGGLGLVEETERQAARSLFGLAIQPADGSRAHPSPSSRKQAGGNAQIRSPVPASILPAKETIAAPPLRKRWKGREAPTRRARRAPRSGSWPTRAIGFPRSILEPEELCRASQRTSRSSGAPGASS